VKKSKEMLERSLKLMKLMSFATLLMPCDVDDPKPHLRKIYMSHVFLSIAFANPYPEWMAIDSSARKVKDTINIQIAVHIL